MAELAAPPGVRRLRALRDRRPGHRVSRPAPAASLPRALARRRRRGIEVALRTPSARLRFGQAIVLGAIHGPAELLPVSSSGHTTLIPWLLGSDYPELEPELRKALEVALHAGAAAGLLIGLPGELRRLDPMLVGLGSIPAGVAGLALERRIEAHTGTPATIAAGLLLGGVALALADRAPQLRHAEDATPRDALWLGVAQAGALIPGVSRNGAALAAARVRRFRRRDAARLSRQLAWPVIFGAVGLKGWRLRGERELRANAPQLAAGALVSSISTLVAVRLAAEGETERPLLPYGIYRAALAILALVRLRRFGGPAGPGLGQRAQDQGHAVSL